MQALPPASVEFPKEISFPAGDRGFLVGEAIVEEVKDAGEGIDSVVMDDDGMAVFQSLKQRLRFIFQPWNTIMAYVKDDKKTRMDNEEKQDNRGVGKTWSVVVLFWFLVKMGGYEIITNIRFSKYLGDGKWQRKNAHPKGVHYATTMTKTLKIATRIRRRDPSKVVILVIDEFPNFLNQLESLSKGSKLFQKVLDIPRKLGLCITGIGPTYDHFAKPFRDMATFKIFKSLRKTVELRRQGYRGSDGKPLNVEDVIFFNALTRRGEVDEWIQVGTCLWTTFPPPVGQSIYETWAVADFEMDDLFIDNYKNMLDVLNSDEISSYDQAGSAGALYDYICQLEGKAGNGNGININGLKDKAAMYHGSTWGRLPSEERFIKGRVWDSKKKRFKRDTCLVEVSDAFMERFIKVETSKP